MKTQTPQSSQAPKATINKMFGRPYHLLFEDDCIKKVRAEGNETAAKLMEYSNSRQREEMEWLCLHGGPFGTIYTGLNVQLGYAEEKGQLLAATAIKAMMNEIGE